jgi:4-hydroxy-3-polyprenylbenzoate decarboxylase
VRTFPSKPKRLIVGLSGASGAVLGLRLMEVLAQTDEVETHLVVSPAARITISDETGRSVKDVEALADVVYQSQDVGAPIASGSFHTDGMVIIPCSIKTLSAVANCYASDLLSRAADVTLKEGRPLLLVVRETPLHVGHLKLMLQAAEMGTIIFPPVPAFYARLSSIDEMVDNTVGRVLARLGVDNNLYTRWQGLGKE